METKSLYLAGSWYSVRSVEVVGPFNGTMVVAVLAVH